MVLIIIELIKIFLQIEMIMGYQAKIYLKPNYFQFRRFLHNFDFL